MSDAAFAEPRRRGRPPRMRLENGVEVVDDGELDVAFAPAEDLRSARAAQVETERGTGAEGMPVPQVVLPQGWYDVDDAPRDGKPMWLLGPEDEKIEAVWRHTRAWDKIGGKWREIGYFAVRNAGGLPVAFLPIAWCPV